MPDCRHGQGVCWLSFINKPEKEAVAELEDFWSKSKLKHDIKRVNQLTEKLFFDSSSKSKSIPVLVFGTPFQIKQWQTLFELNFGETITYSELAKRSGFPKAIRAAGTAIGKNNVSFLIPCHRIVRSDGSVGNYRWGAEVKKKLIDREKEKAGK